jgi:hypothetical protein
MVVIPNSKTRQDLQSRKSRGKLKTMKGKTIFTIILILILAINMTVRSVGKESDSIRSEICSPDIEQSGKKNINIWKEMPNNLITNTSIAGVKIIGKTPETVKKHINPSLNLEENKDKITIKNGNTLLVEIEMNWDGIIDTVKIWDSSLSLITADNLQIGSTSGEIQRLYPNATVWSGKYESIFVNGISYVFKHDTISAGKYPCIEEVEESEILNKNVKITALFLILY